MSGRCMHKPWDARGGRFVDSETHRRRLASANVKVTLPVVELKA